MEATGKCHLRVTIKRKPSRTTAIVAIQVLVIHVVALLAPAHSPLCQLQLLHFYPLHENIKSSRFIFFGLSFTWGRMGKFLRPSSREEAQSCTPCASHMHPIPSAHSVCRGARGQQQEPAVSGMGHGANAIFYSRGSSVSCHQTAQAGSMSPDRRAEGLAGHTGVTHKGRFAFQNYPCSGAVPYLPFPSAPGDTIPFLHQLGVFGSKGNLVPPQ